MAFTLPDLPYDFNALEPHLDGRTMEIHYTKHHTTYLNKFNEAIKGTEYESMAIEDIIAKGTSLPNPVRNTGGGYHNHNFYWSVMAPGGGEPEGDLKAAIEKDFGSVDEFKKKFNTAAATQFGSGWAWLVKNGDKLEVTQTPNQDNPLSEGKTPLLTVDVWEHAYYLHYQNRRPDFVEAWWNVVNWKKVGELYAAA